MILKWLLTRIVSFINFYFLTTSYGISADEFLTY